MADIAVSPIPKDPDGKKEEDASAQPDPKVEHHPAPRVRTTWGLGYIKRKFLERRAKYEAQNSEEKAAWRTANATVWIAIFTIVLALVGGFTLYEVVSGGEDTKKLVEAAAKQADASKRQAGAAVQQVSNFAALAMNAGIQADQAVVQAKAANALANAAKIQSENTVSLAQAAREQILKLETQNNLLAGQLEAMNKSMKLSESQSRAAIGESIAALQFDQRPWVEFDKIDFVSNWSWYNSGYFVEVSVTVKNIGKTPAQGVVVDFEMLPFVGAKITKENDPCVSFPAVFGRHVVFPQRTLTQSFSMYISQTDIDAMKKAMLGDAYNGPFSGKPWVLGCVTYHDGLTTVTHETSSSYELLARYPGMPVPYDIQFNREEIDRAKLILQPTLGRIGNYAK